jgi:hypothetical protein
MGGVVTPERERHDSYWRDNEAADKLTRQRAKLTCLTMERPHDPEDGYGYFHRGWARARMWEQYARRHSGACLVFLKDYLHSAIAEAVPERAQLFHGPVVYEDRRLTSTLSWTQIDRVGMEEAVRRYLRQHWQQRFFTKNSDWSSEVEYRYLVVHDGEPLMVPIENALVAIVLGANFPSADLPTLKVDLMVSGLEDLPLGACRWHNGAPWLGQPFTWSRDERI